MEGLLVGAIVSSTDAAAVFFLMRSNGVQLRRRVNNTLEIESATNDPVAVFLTVALVEMILLREAETGWVIGRCSCSRRLYSSALGILLGGHRPGLRPSISPGRARPATGCIR